MTCIDYRACSLVGRLSDSRNLGPSLRCFSQCRRVELLFLGRAHTAGDIVAWVPDESVMFMGDIVEYHSACYCGDAHFND